MSRKSFEQQLDEIESLLDLGFFVSDMDKNTGPRKKSALCKRAVDLMTDSADELDIFCIRCPFETTNLKLVRLFIDRYGIADFGTAVLLCKMLFSINVNKYHANTKPLCNGLLATCIDMSVTSSIIGDDEFLKLISYVDDILQKMSYFPPEVHSEVHYSKLKLFVSCIVNLIVHRIGQGYPKEKFLEQANNVYFRCDLMLAIAQMKDVSIKTLANFYDDDIFYCPTGVMKEVCSTYVALLQRTEEVLRSGKHDIDSKEGRKVRRKIQECNKEKGGAQAVLRKKSKRAAKN